MDGLTRQKLPSAVWLILTIALLSTFLGCRSAGTPGPARSPLLLLPGAVGYSGMVRHGPASYLVVHDTKVYEDGPRLGLVEITTDSGQRYSSLEITDWKDSDGRSNDLESACSVPRRPGEYLLAESGYWESKYGRVFHLRFTDGKAEILRAYKLPLVADNNEQQEGDNFEGIACASLNDEHVLVVLGERGGSSLYPTGLLRWGILDLRRGSLAWHNDGHANIEVKSPGNWPANSGKRDIADLYAAPGGILWGVATADAGDNGPFRSVIYNLGIIAANAARPLELNEPQSAAWIIDGLKVESLAGPIELVEGSWLSFGSEDENFGGVWRALYPTLGKE